MFTQRSFSVALEVAAENGFTQIVERLLQKGANVNHQNKVHVVNRDTFINYP